MDVLFEIKRLSQGQKILAGETLSTLDALCAQSSAWETLRRFAVLWIDPNHDFSTHIRNIWLEFDTATIKHSSQATEILSRPSIFFGPNSKTLQKEQDVHLICDALHALGNTMFDEGSLRSLMTKLPDKSRIFQVGLMLSRLNPGLRICIYPLTAEEIPALLQAAGWQGDLEMVSEILRQLPLELESFAVDVDLMTDGLADKIGIECYMDWFENDPQQWAPFLDRLVEMGLCLPSKYRGILDFQGMMPFPKDWHSFPDKIIYPFLYRKIHHIKLSLRERQITEAKAYLALSHPGLNQNAIFSKNAGGAWLV